MMSTKHDKKGTRRLVGQHGVMWVDPTKVRMTDLEKDKSKCSMFLRDVQNSVSTSDIYCWLFSSKNGPSTVVCKNGVTVRSTISYDVILDTVT